MMAKNFYQNQIAKTMNINKIENELKEILKTLIVKR